MKPLIYIAGPYRAKTINGIYKNIQAARNAAVELAQNGYPFICPHLNSAFMDGIRDDEFWLAMGKELLARCTAVLALNGWSKSKGTKLEIARAKEISIPIFYNLNELNRWARGDE